MYFLPSFAFRLICFLEFAGDSVLRGFLRDSTIEDSARLHDGKGQSCTKTNINRHVSVFRLTCGSIY
jgi:predicted CDP-diglyceride synthetase/phosphatidate cytidylyltransferase